MQKKHIIVWLNEPILRNGTYINWKWMGEAIHLLNGSLTAYLCLPNLNLIVQLNLVLSSKEHGCCKGTKTFRINNSS